MRKAKKCLGFLLAAVLLVSLLTGCSCRNFVENLAEKVHENEDYSAFYGTWVSTVNTKVNSDLDQIADYKIFDANGYWDVYITYRGLRNGMEAQPKSFTTFEHFIDGNILPGISGCTFEYVENTPDKHYSDTFKVNEDGTLERKNSNSLFYQKHSPCVGYPENSILEECKEIFERAAADYQEARKAEIEMLIQMIFGMAAATGTSDLTIEEAIDLTFTQYTRSYEAYGDSDTVFVVTVSGKYRPYPTTYPSIVWSGNISWLVDIENDIATIHNDPYDIADAFDEVSFRNNPFNY